VFTQNGQNGLVINLTQIGPLDRPSLDGPSFDDDVLSFAQGHARILRELGYRSEAVHIERFVDRQTPTDEAPAA
jgi:hypothetical protein